MGPGGIVLLAPDAAEARRLLDEELAKTPYLDAQPNLLERVIEGVLRSIGEFLDGLTGLGAGPGTVVLAIGAALVVLIAVLLVKPRLNARGRTTGTAVFEDGGRYSAAEHRTRASGFAATGDWNSAVAETLRALIRTAEERLVLDEQPGRTAAEAGVQLGAVFPALAPEIRRLTGLFDETRYGSGQASAEDHRRAVAVDTAASAERPGRSLDTTTMAAPR
ncbi:hypothetical protein AC792_05385 [Arthrobacter sp. RIT-PI-e]|nr:hypothetical protein AC792_05385 [Arthrobacter sp. RIT-PI-e]